jgi:hypothetical protein
MTKRTQSRQTAAEFLAELERDPAFRARREQQRKAEEERRRVLDEASLPLIHDLEGVGVHVQSSVYELLKLKDYGQAVPILFAHFERPYPDVVREGIARALTIAEARPYWHRLMGLYRRETQPQAKEGLAVALSGIAWSDVLDDVVTMAADPSLGPSRILMVGELGRIKDPRVRRALMSLGDDEYLRREVDAQLKKINRRKKR